MAFTLLGTGAAFFGNNTLTASAATTTSSQWVSSTIEIVRTYKNGKLVSTKTIYHKPTNTPVISTPAVNIPTTNTDSDFEKELQKNKQQISEEFEKPMNGVHAACTMGDAASMAQSALTNGGNLTTSDKLPVSGFGALEKEVDIWRDKTIDYYATLKTISEISR